MSKHYEHLSKEEWDHLAIMKGHVKGVMSRIKSTHDLRFLISSSTGVPVPPIYSVRVAIFAFTSILLYPKFHAYNHSAHLYLSAEVA